MQVLYLASTSPQGGMSEKIYRYDWSLTALGPLLQWPATLRIAVDMLLGSKFPGCLVWGPQMVTLYNDAFIPILGAKPEALGRGFDEVWAEAWDIIGPMVFRTYAGEAIFMENFPMMTNRNGAMEQTYFTFCYSPVRDESGAVAGFLDMAVETTANVESLHSWRTLANTFEHQLQARTLDRNRFWQLSTDVMLVVTHDLIISSVNPAWTQVLGWEESEMLDTPLIDLVHLDDVPNIERVVGQLLLGVTCENEHSRVRHKDGHYRWFNWSATPSDESFIAVGRDATLEREREESIKHADQLLQDSRKVQVLGQLCNGIAHDFNNLLTGISGSLEVLERRIAQGRLEKIQDYIDAARNAAERATALTQRLLAFSDSRSLAPAPVDLNALVQALAPSIQQVMGHTCFVQIQVEPAPWLALIDARQLENALLSLCINAREAMRSGGVVRISTGNDRYSTQLGWADDLVPGDYVYVQVEDQGHGMSSDIVSRAFEPFFTTKPKGQGAGLGLSMVQSFVRQSEGGISIDSTPGVGTRVKMRLPRYNGQMPAPQVRQALPDTLAHLHGAHIVLIDDELAICMVITQALQEQGLTVHSAHDVSAGLALFHSLERVDLLITDIGLRGGLTGCQVAETVRKFKPEQKVLFITGFSEQRMADSDCLGGGAALLVKPFTMDALVHAVLTLLEAGPSQTGIPAEQVLI